MGGFPFQEDGSVGFGLEEGDQEKDETGDYQRYPFGPAPGDERRGGDEAAYDGAEDGTHEGGIGKNREGIDAFHWGPEVGNRATGTGQRRGCETAGDEAEG